MLLFEAGLASQEGAVTTTLADDVTDPSFLVGDLVIEDRFGSSSPITGEASGFVDNDGGRDRGSWTSPPVRSATTMTAMSRGRRVRGSERCDDRPRGGDPSRPHGKTVEHIAGEQVGTITRDGKVMTAVKASPLGAEAGSLAMRSALQAVARAMKEDSRRHACEAGAAGLDVGRTQAPASRTGRDPRAFPLDQRERQHLAPLQRHAVEERGHGASRDLVQGLGHGGQGGGGARALGHAVEPHH